MRTAPLYVRIVVYGCVSGLLALASVILGLACGSVPLDISQVMQALFVPDQASPAHQAIVLQLRLPRVILAALVGASLAISGAGFQSILRNPLADPYIVGTSAGASLGAALAIIFHLPILPGGFSAVPICAFLGAVAAMLTVMMLTRVNRTLPMDTFLLAGVVVGSFCGAMVSFLMTLAGSDLHRVMIWLMGSLASASYSDTLMMLPYVIIGTLGMLLLSRPLNIMAMGEESAAALGVNVEHLKIAVIICCSLMTAASVAAAGLIGFLGLIVPHVVRMICGPDHRLLLPVSALCGGGFLIIADAAARVVLMPQELPVGVLTAVLGAPFFCWLLRRRKAVC